MFWEVFLECPKCGKQHLNMTVAFDPAGTVHLAVDCCASIVHTMTWEDAVAGATKQEEAFLFRTPDGRKQLTKNWKAEN